jgi:uncharacterized protein (DUF58 family)
MTSYSFPGGWVGRDPQNPAGVARDLFVILMAIVIIVGAVTGSVLVVALSTLAFVVTLTARVWAALSLQDLEYAFQGASTHVFVGDEVEVTMMFENRKPLPLPWLNVHEFIPGGLELVGSEDKFIDYMGGTPLDEVVSLGRYERLRRKHRLRALARGHYSFGPSELTSGDLFGLYVRKKALGRHTWNLIVYPKTVPMPELELPTARPIGDTKSNLPLWRDPTRPAGIREYRPGDPVKTIDWKATARRNNLFVRVFDPSVSQYLMVLVEGTTTERPWEGFRLDVLEALASCAGSVATRATDLGFRTGLIINSTLSLGGRNVVRPASGPSQLSAILESLAMMRPATMAQLQDLARVRARDALPAGATVVFVAGQMREGAVAYVSELARRGHPVLTLWVGREDPPNLRGLHVLDYRDVFGTAREPKGSAFERPKTGPRAPSSPLEALRG